MCKFLIEKITGILQVKSTSMQVLQHKQAAVYWNTEKVSLMHDKQMAQ